VHTLRTSWRSWRRWSPLLALGLLLATWWGVSAAAQASDQAAEPIVIGVNADMSSVNEAVGRAIERGALLAIEAINDSGGVLGRPLALSVRDHRRNPARGEANVHAFAADDRVVAVLGGKHTPVILAELESIHLLGLPYLIPWSAGTALIDHSFVPSYTFRVSVRDADAAGVLVTHALAQGGERFGLLLEQTGWGRSNEAALSQALADTGRAPVRVEWFNWGQLDFGPALARLRAAGADTVLFVGNAPEGVALVRSLLVIPTALRPAVVSHWGVVGEAFELELAAALGEVDFTALTTFSFVDPPFPERAASVFERYIERFGGSGVLADVVAVPGVAHAYDAVHLIALALELAGSTERAALRDALERVPFHAGLVRDYDPPFTPERHEALDPSDLRMAVYRDGVWVPVGSLR